jgi:hypothetical protein
MESKAYPLQPYTVGAWEGAKIIVESMVFLDEKHDVLNGGMGGHALLLRLGQRRRQSPCCRALPRATALLLGRYYPKESYAFMCH